MLFKIRLNLIKLIALLDQKLFSSFIHYSTIDESVVAFRGVLANGLVTVWTARHVLGKRARKVLQTKELAMVVHKIFLAHSKKGIERPSSEEVSTSKKNDRVLVKINFSIGLTLQ